MSRHTKAGRRNAARGYYLFASWLFGRSRARGTSTGGGDVVPCLCDFRGCGGDCCVCTCGGEMECGGCEDCDFRNDLYDTDDEEMWTEDGYGGEDSP